MGAKDPRGSAHPCAAMAVQVDSASPSQVIGSAHVQKRYIVFNSGVAVAAQICNADHRSMVRLQRWIITELEWPSITFGRGRKYYQEAEENKEFLRANGSPLAFRLSTLSLSFQFTVPLEGPRK